MRRYTKALLLVFVALLYAGSANAYMVSMAGPTSVLESDIINVDLMLDTEGEALYGYTMRVWYDPAVLSSTGGEVFHPLPASDSSSLYAYADGWYVTDIVFAGIPAPGINASLATLVFHVMNVAGSDTTDIIPVVTALAGTGAANFAGATTVVPLSVHVTTVPEPTTTMLMGLGLLGILYAGRRR